MRLFGIDRLETSTGSIARLSSSLARKGKFGKRVGGNLSTGSTKEANVSEYTGMATGQALARMRHAELLEEAADLRAERNQGGRRPNKAV